MSWLDEENPRQTREQDRPEPDLIDLDHREMVRHVDDDVAGLAAVARTAGPRDLRDIRRQAAEVGAALGRVLDPPHNGKPSEGTRAYYRWKAGESIIEGPTVDLMDALAGIWGRLLYTIRLVEETGSRVHLRGRVLDLVNVVAHERDYVGHLRAAPGKFAAKPDEVERWKVMQLQSAESKAIRGVLEHVIPSWVVEVALESARDAAAKERLGNMKLEAAIKAALVVFEKHGLPWDVLVRWAGGDPPTWTAFTIGALQTLNARIKRGEVTLAAVAQEALQLEADRAMEAAAATPKASGGDRLESLGLGGGQQTAAVDGTGGPSTQPGTAPAPGGPAESSAAPGPGAGVSAGRPPNAARDAEDIRSAIGVTRVITTARAKDALRAGAGIASVRDQRFQAAIDHGIAQGWWIATENGLQAPPAGELSGQALLDAINAAERQLPDPDIADRIYAETIGDAEKTEETARKYLRALKIAANARS